MSTWRVVTSPKPQRKGEHFIQRDGVFVLKVYKGATANDKAFADWLVKNLQACSDKKEQL